ncbi:MAG: hypothetical protein CMG69_00275 [Candidatus Marinimicrobia bacterium]|nr:hypothetical protein [Candidatus Neomarinimicrobiota bacterium]|tara:strand:- start:798 stop:2894 length:2097 start_codon:yes stop_codon:yes gene_type:complete
MNGIIKKSMTPNSVSVIIVSFNVKQYLIHCLESVLQTNYKGKVEIIIVDNNSFDGTADMIRERFSKCNLISNQKNVGFGKAVNQAIKIASSEYVLILNPDTVLQEDTISTFVKYLKLNSDVGLVGPKIINPDGTLQLACKRTFPSLSVALPKLLGLSRLFPHSKWTGKYNLTYLDSDEIHSVDAISGSCMFLRVSLFKTIGGFDEQFFLFGEDLDLCHRIKKEGKEVHYLPTTQIIHYKGESVKSAPYDSITAFYNAMLLFYKKQLSKSQNLLFYLAIHLGLRVRKFISFIADRKSQLLSVFLDSFVVLLAFVGSIFLKFSDFDPIYLSQGLVPTVYIFFWLIIGYYFQLYGKNILSYSAAVLSSLTGFFVVVAFTYFFKQFAFSRFVILAASGVITLFIPGWRLIAHFIMSRGYVNSIKDKHNILFTKKTLVVGANKSGIELVKKIYHRVNSGLNIIGFTDSKLQIDQSELPVPFLGSLDDIRALVKTYRIREIIFSDNALPYQKIVSLMDFTKDLQLTYRMVPREQDYIIGKGSIEEIGELSFLNIEYSFYYSINQVTKRIFDIVFSCISLLLFSPAIIIKLLSGSKKEILFWGENNKTFTAFLFQSERHFIQRLPLLWSVLKGNISFVGSPLIECSKKDPKLICPPGLSSLEKIKETQINTYNRQLFDHYYVQNQSIGLDIEILLKATIIYLRNA